MELIAYYLCKTRIKDPCVTEESYVISSIKFLTFQSIEEINVLLTFGYNLKNSW